MNKSVLASVALTAALAATTVTPARAGLLTYVPMQGPMVHVGIQYATHGSPHLHIHIDPDIPELVPLSLSNPGDWFDSGDPWFSDLDPSAGGAAFNRQYGFVLDGASDPLPPGYGIWIRQLSATPGLEVFRYRQSPAEWTPIFGTDGSPNTLQWNLGMFHPAYTAPPSWPTNHVATYEAFVVDEFGNDTGISETFQLQWTVAIPEPGVFSLAVVGLGGALAWRRLRR